MITALGIDMALANMGLAYVRIITDVTPMRVLVDRLELVCTDKQTGKTVRKSSDDLRRAQVLSEALRQATSRVQLVFAEVPSGSQNAGAARALGIAVGVLGGVQVPVVEVSQQEVKLATVGKKTASKPEMIAWATQGWPSAPWLRVKSTGRLTNANEHLADALASVCAGLRTPQFRQACAILSPGHLAPKRVRVVP